MSQISTAPSTPQQLQFLPDCQIPDMKLSPSCERRRRFDSQESIAEEDDEDWSFVGPPEPRLTSQLGKWAQAQSRVTTEPRLTSQLGKWAQSRVEQEVQCLGLGPLESDLGQWAQWVVEAEQSPMGMWAQRHSEPKGHCFGFPPLQSELGQWAQRLVEAQEWLAEQKQRQGLATEQYLVEDSGLRAVSTGLAYRKSKCVEDRELDVHGPMWGTTVAGIDEGDGWLKVGQHYLPMVLGGRRVLTPTLQCSLGAKTTDYDQHSEPDAEPMCDGPALTECGRVVDLDGGAPIRFASDPILSSGHSCKCIMIDAAKYVKKAQTKLEASSSASEVDAGAVCSIDPDGVMHGAASLSWRPAIATTEAAAAAKSRLKLFHQKAVQRKRRQANRNHDVIGIDPNGKAFLFFYLPCRMAKLKKKLHRQERASLAGSSQVSATATVLSIDLNGVVRDASCDE